MAAPRRVAAREGAEPDRCASTTPHVRRRLLAVTKLLVCGAIMTALAAHAQNLPELYGVRLDGMRIAIDVVSNGCTDASHFSLAVESEPGSGAQRLSVIRHQQDRCRMAAHIVTVMLDLPAHPDMNAVRYRLLNSLAVPGTLRLSDP